MEEERLSLNYFLQLCLQFEDDPTPENDLAIKKFLSSLQIKDYLPLQDKTMISVDIIRNLIDELDATGAASTLEIDKIFKGLMSYVINMDVDIGILDRTYVAYDYCHEYKLVDTILKVCDKDFTRFCAYVDGMVNVSNAYRLIQTASILNDTEYSKWVDALSKFKEEFTPETLKALLAVDAMNNGGDEFEQTLGEISLAETNDILVSDEAKYKAIGKDLDNKLNYNTQEEINEEQEDK